MNSWLSWRATLGSFQPVRSVSGWSVAGAAAGAGGAPGTTARGTTAPARAMGEGGGAADGDAAGTVAVVALVGGGPPARGARGVAAVVVLASEAAATVVCTAGAGFRSPASHTITATTMTPIKPMTARFTRAI